MESLYLFSMLFTFPFNMRCCLCPPRQCKSFQSIGKFNHVRTWWQLSLRLALNASLSSSIRIAELWIKCDLVCFQRSHRITLLPVWHLALGRSCWLLILVRFTCRKHRTHTNEDGAILLFRSSDSRVGNQSLFVSEFMHSSCYHFSIRWK